MKYKIIFAGQLPGLNEYIKANRINKYAGSKMKAETEKKLIFDIRRQLGVLMIKKPVHIDYVWVEESRKRDKDNISFAKKFIQDALVKANVLQNDGWEQIHGFTDKFVTDKKNLRVEIVINEID